MGCVASKEQGAGPTLVAAAPAAVIHAKGSTKASAAVAKENGGAQASAAVAKENGGAQASAKEAAPEVEHPVVPFKKEPYVLIDARIFPTEAKRMAQLHATGSVGAPPERRFDAITELMGFLFQTPLSLATMLVDDQVLFRSKWGPIGSCVNRAGSWCDWSLIPTQPEVLVCEDASKDARFSGNPNVAGAPYIRFYAGAPLLGRNGLRYGTLNVIDLRPRSFTAEMYSLLLNFAALVVREMERDMTSGTGAAEASAAKMEGVLLLDVRRPGWRVLYANDAWGAHSGVAPEEATRKGSFWDQYEEIEASERERVEAALAAGKPARVDVRSRATGREMTVVLRPASSDQVFPNHPPTGVPNWVPSELAPTKPGPPQPGSLLNCGPAMAGKLAGADASDADATPAADAPAAPVGTSYWFAVVEPEPVTPPLAEPSPANLSLGLDSRRVRPQRSSRGSDRSSARSSSNWSYAREPGTPGYEQDRSALRCQSSASSVLSAYGERRVPEELEADLFLGPFIGKGSFGKVYRGMWQGKACAVKLVECCQDSKQVEATLSEAILSTSFVHDNLVQTYQHVLVPLPGGQECVVWIVQQLCSRGTLLDAAEVGLLRKERSLDAPPDMPCVLRTLREVAAGVAFLHARGVIHRDLTGKNVLLDAAEPTAADPRGFVCRVGDFGMSRVVAAEEAQTANFGTVTHMAPELLRDGVLSPSSDVYSFGVLCWELYNGVRAFAGVPMPTVIYRVTTGRGVLDMPDSAPLGFKALVSACLNQDYKQRPSFKTVLTLIDSLLEQNGGAAQN